MKKGELNFSGLRKMQKNQGLISPNHKIRGKLIVKKPDVTFQWFEENAKKPGVVLI